MVLGGRSRPDKDDVAAICYLVVLVVIVGICWVNDINMFFHHFFQIVFLRFFPRFFGPPSSGRSSLLSSRLRSCLCTC